MENKNIFLIVLGILFLISSVVAINLYLKYNELNEQWNQYSDYGDIKVKLPVDTTTEAIVVASSSNDFNELINSDINYYYVTPKLSGIDGEEYSIIFTGRYDYNLDEKPYYFTVSKSGEMKTMSDFRAEREATR
ncbi:hypothetical protein HYX16_00685 [Candidatus Woesearchaeota archaeon]|nr:hypothetical protein [Candidatus Woesearchaeota archaeon]